MFKFNNNHIFTGYLKQLLASFHLPKCKVYTKELETQQAEYITQNIEKLLKSLTATQLQLKIDIAELTQKIAAGETSLEGLQNEYKEEYKSLAERISNLKTKIPQILPTTYHSKYDIYPGSLSELSEDEKKALEYPAELRYIPYIKDGYLQVFTNGTWHACHNSFRGQNNFQLTDHDKFHRNTQTPYSKIQYTYNQKILNYTKNLQIQNTIYDSYTHEYLGDYLRFHRDFANINLMPLYNCFSNRACPHLDLSFEVGTNYKASFKTDQTFETALYKYYMVPVKFFKNYTIAMDSESSIEVCCCIYDTYYNTDTDFSNIAKLTYQCFS